MEIPLTQGQVALVDDIDADLADFAWAAAYRPAYASLCKFVATRKVKGGTEYLHRVVLGRVLGRVLDTKELVDHRDTYPLNCMRNNLRLASYVQNGGNRTISKNNTSGYKGVHKHRNKWRAMIGVDGTMVGLGVYDDIEDAARAYNDAAILHFGEFALLNEV